MKIPALFLITVVAFSNITYSQNLFSGFNHERFTDKLSIKGGIDFSSAFNHNLQRMEKMSMSSFWGSIAYDYNKNLQFELMYKNLGERNNDYMRITYNQFPVFYYYLKFDDYFPNEIRFKSNYFFNKDKTSNPFYLTGSLVCDWQRVKNTESSFLEVLDSLHRITTETFTHNVISSYNRILLGFNAGFGIYFEFGHINFQTEFSFTAKVAPFVNRGYKDYSFDISFAPVYKF